MPLHQKMGAYCFTIVLLSAQIQDENLTTFLSGVFSFHTSAEACEKNSRWLWKEKLFENWCEKARKHICVADVHDMSIAVKVAFTHSHTMTPFDAPGKQAF